ncbi:enoyl-CoA hydratase [Bacillus sp. FJAT-42376]|uniref:enoyl-CoA hydratase n=1 Tax=Bacillus sp. FJAT-42376 TaxID=2014076 RepID=UPI000F50B793|nr:enoyl-CoA hydratase [Bacillus sp. FJAT-42376]AZB42215.1 enoyl-CoA hydratase [Bacillus sp. FJAT-42376]
MKTVNVSYEGRIAKIELNRPDVLNAMDSEMLSELLAAFKEVRDSEADVLILTGAGRGFSSGGDIKSMLSNMDESAFSSVMHTISQMIVELYTMPKLTISAIHGAAAGLGFSLALATDHVMAHETAILSMNFIGIGLIPDGGGHFFMEKRLGETKAKQMIWEGRRLSAEEARAHGLIDQMVSGDLRAAAEEKISEWLEKPVAAMIETKRIYTSRSAGQLEKMLSLETSSQYKMRQTRDHKEGISSFLEKRQPQFSGK